MPIYVNLENKDGSPTGFRAVLDQSAGSAYGNLVSIAITDDTGLRVARGECAEPELRSLAQGDWDSNYKLPLPEEKEFDSSPISITMRAYPFGMLETNFGGLTQYLPRAETFEGLRSLFPN